MAGCPPGEKGALHMRKLITWRRTGRSSGHFGSRERELWQRVSDRRSEARRVLSTRRHRARQRRWDLLHRSGERPVRKLRRRQRNGDGRRDEVRRRLRSLRRAFGRLQYRQPEDALRVPEWEHIRCRPHHGQRFSRQRGHVRVGHHAEPRRGYCLGESRRQGISHRSQLDLAEHFTGELPGSRSELTRRTDSRRAQPPWLRPPISPKRHARSWQT